MTSSSLVRQTRLGEDLAEMMMKKKTLMTSLMMTQVSKTVVKKATMKV